MENPPGCLWVWWDLILLVSQIKQHNFLYECACHSCTGAMLIFSGIIPTTFIFNFKYLFICLLLRCWACRLLAPPPGIEPSPPAVEAQSLNHWTTRKSPFSDFSTYAAKAHTTVSFSHLNNPLCWEILLSFVFLLFLSPPNLILLLVFCLLNLNIWKRRISFLLTHI